MKKTWFALKKIVDGIRIDLYDEIGGWGIRAIDFKTALDATGPGDLAIHINSPGGSITEGTAIYNILKAREGKKTVYIDGIAASMASVIAMAGDEIIMPENAFLMIHNPWTVAIGDAAELRKNAELLDKMKVSIISAYRRSGKTDEELAALMDAETWMDGCEAVEMGFANRTTDALKVAASVDLTKLTHVDPRAALVQARFEGWKAGHTEGRTERTLEISAELDGLQVRIKDQEKAIEQANANISQMQQDNQRLSQELTEANGAKVLADSQRDEEQRKRLLMLPAVKLMPELTWADALVKTGNDFARAKKDHPQAYSAFMAANKAFCKENTKINR